MEPRGRGDGAMCVLWAFVLSLRSLSASFATNVASFALPHLLGRDMT